MDVSDSIIIAVLSFIGTLVGAWAGVLKSNQLTNYRIQELEKKVDKHNSVIEKTHVLEKECAVINQRLKDLEEA